MKASPGHLDPQHEWTTDSSPRGLHRVAWITSACTLFLIFVGGTVTSNDAGLAVPDWPTTFGQNMFLFPPNEWVGGVFFEHSHRLAGALVGMLTITLAVWTQRTDGRRWVRVMAWAMLAAVIVQGIMGGLRVTELSIELAVVHACFAQLFFCSTLCMIVFTSQSWPDGIRQRRIITGFFWPRMCLLTVAVVFLQLVAGALYRHLGISLAYHVVGACLVTVAISLTLMWVSGEHADAPLMRRLAGWTAATLIVQMGLGIGAYLSVIMNRPGGLASVFQWFIPSAHVMVGALLLGLSTALCVSVWAIVRVSPNRDGVPTSPMEVRVT